MPQVDFRSICDRFIAQGDVQFPAPRRGRFYHGVNLLLIIMYMVLNMI